MILGLYSHQIGRPGADFEVSQFVRDQRSRVARGALSTFGRDFAMDIHVPDTLWALSMLPVGTLECWLVEDGVVVARGEALAKVRIEDALHEILAPAAGRLSIALPVNSIIEPGAVLGATSPSEA